MRWFGTVDLRKSNQKRELGEDLALVRNPAAQNMVKGGDAVAGDEEQLICGERVDVAYLAAGGKGKRSKVGLEKSCRHHVDGTTSWNRKQVEWCLAKGKSLVDGPGSPGGPVWTTTEDKSCRGKSYCEGGVCVAFPVIERDGLDLVTEKWREGRTIIDVDVDSNIALSGVRPWVDLVEKMIADGDHLVGARIEEMSERYQDR